MHKLNSIFNLALQRDLTVYARHKGEWLIVGLFFIMIVSLFPLVIGPLPKELLWLVPVIIWIAAILASLLAQEGLWRTDYQLGIFEQCIVAAQPLSVIVLAKVAANWLVTGLPLILITPVLCMSFALPFKVIKCLVISLLLGTPTLSLLGTLGIAMTLSLPRGGLLLNVLILPLYIPVLVLGASAGVLTLQNLNSNGQLALLAALAIIAFLTVPLAISGLIKVSTA